MAPLIPNGIVGMEWDLFFALFIGIAFGYVLESAGFSSSRRLAGVFYGYDFTVLRVFFTAAVTAMTGLFFMNYLGWIDMSAVFVNPTYLGPAIVGGVIMGFGFILGGYCPGTSVTALAIGKIDAFVFLFGIFLGIIGYGEIFPLVESFSVSGYLGPIFVFDSLGISAGWFAFILIAVALIAFGVTAMIEQKVNPESGLADTKGTSYIIPVSLALIVGVVLIFTPFEKISTVNEISAKQLEQDILFADRYVTADEVAFKLLNNYHPMVLVDVRDPAENAEFSLPESVNIPLNALHNKKWEQILSSKDKKVVLYSNGSTLADKAWGIARRLGFENVYVLEGGLNGFFETLEMSAEPDGKTMESAFANTFRKRARNAFKEGVVPITKAKKDPEADHQVATSPRGGC